jgi:hypothetical protein
MPDPERLRVLRLLQTGQITAEEASELLDALEPSGAPTRPPRSTRMLRVRITNPHNGTVETFAVPLSAAQLAARAGIGLSGWLPPKVGGLDLTRVLRAVQAGTPGEVFRWTEADGDRIEIVISE